jgi:hypothetical protein
MRLGPLGLPVGLPLGLEPPLLGPPLLGLVQQLQGLLLPSVAAPKSPLLLP